MSAVKNQKTLFFSLSPVSLLLGVIQRSNEIIMEDKQPIFSRQSVSLTNIFVAEDIVHYLPNFVATWNPPFIACLHGSGSGRKIFNMSNPVYRSRKQKNHRPRGVGGGGGDSGPDERKGTRALCDFQRKIREGNTIQYCSYPTPSPNCCG